MPTFGNTDIIQDQNGNALPNVTITVYGSQANATSQTSPLGSAQTNSKGQWPLTVNGVDQVWARDPSGDIWVVASDTVAGDHAARLSALETGTVFAPASGSSTYETQSHASSTYETQAHASSTYAPASGSGVYETQAHAASTYAPATGSAVYETAAHAAATYSLPGSGVAFNLLYRDGSNTPGWTTSHASVARALGWFIVTDPQWSGGADPTGTTDSYSAINAAINACNNGGGTSGNTAGGGTVWFPAGTYLVGTTLTLYSGVHLRGSGVGGRLFSDTDAALPFRGSVLKVKNSANVDLIQTVNFATLTGTTTNSDYTVPSRFGIHDLVLDGNKANNTSGIPLRVFGGAYEVDHVVIQNGAAGGAYSEWGTGGSEMEARWSNFTISDNNGHGLDWNGPHDSLFNNGTVARNNGFDGIKMTGANVGGEMFTNVHVWGSHTYQWVIGSSNAAFLNCVSDGPGGVQVLGSGNSWIGGAIYGSNSIGDVAITLGDGTTRTVASNTFRTRVFNLSKGIFSKLMASTTNQANTFQISGNMGGNLRYTGGQGQSTTTSALTFPVTTIPVANAASFPASGSVYITDGTTFVVANYTGISSNTLTGVTGGAGSPTTGAAIFSLSTGAAGDTWEITDRDNASANGFFQTNQSTLLTRVILSNWSLNVGAHTIRPNSSSAAATWLRNETSRIDLQWDNSGSVGNFYFMNGAVITGRKDTTNKTVVINTATGGVQPGTNANGTGSTIYSGTGAPTISIPVASPVTGDIYIRTDTPSTANQRIYICTTGGSSSVWSGII